jgi:drug/metabolite transporter (DMT)-like permease
MSKIKSGPWLIVLAASLWAVDAPFRKFLTEDLSSTAIVLMEHLVIAVLVFVFLYKYLSELKNLSWKEWLAVGFIAVGGSALATVFFTQSFRYVNPSVAILLQKVQPFIAILMAVLILKEKLNKKFWIWALIGIFGAYLVSFPGLKISGLVFSGWNLGILYALLAAFFWGGSTVFGRFVLQKVSFQAMTSVRFLAALIFLVLLAMYQGSLAEVGTATAKDWLYVLIIAVLAGFVSLFVYYKGLKHTKASIATIGELAFPFAAVVVNWVALDATLEMGQIAGGLILLYAVVKLSTVGDESAILNA